MKPRSFRLRTSDGYRALDDVKDEIDVLMKLEGTPLAQERAFYNAWSKVDRAIRAFEKWADAGDTLRRRHGHHIR
jgi:hypothetical protein